MKKMAIVGLALLALAACGKSSTALDTLEPRFNGGTYGGGLAVPPPPEGATASTDGEGCKVERGGGTYGGGLYTQPACVEP